MVDPFFFLGVFFLQSRSVLVFFSRHPGGVDNSRRRPWVSPLRKRCARSCPIPGGMCLDISGSCSTFEMSVFFLFVFRLILCLLHPLVSHKQDVVFMRGKIRRRGAHLVISSFFFWHRSPKNDHVSSTLLWIGPVPSIFSLSYKGLDEFLKQVRSLTAIMLA